MIGLDWRVPIDRGWELVGEERGVQGNLDPTLLLGPFERVERGGRADPRGGRTAGPGTSSISATESCRRRIRPISGRLVELVHERTATEVPA